MSKNYFIKISLLFAFIFVIGLPVCVLAQGAGGLTGGSIDNPLAASDFTTLVNSIIDWLIIIGSSVAVIMIIYAGFLWMTSGGNEEKVTKARQTLTWALVGLGILMIGKGFVLILKNLLGVS